MRDARRRRTLAAVLTLALVLAVAALATGCTQQAEESSDTVVPRNVLPEAGTPIVYEFYTDT
jgi:hypothetical protein